MKQLFFFTAILFLLPLALTAQKVIAIKIDGSINPASADYIHDGIEKARNEQAAALVIQLNTPGGLLESTRRIVSDMLSSPVPVIVFVSPSGAHAGSAGVFITLAANIAAMAPGTNIGAAHPVSMQGQPDSTMRDKATNDAAAFIRSIAQKRHRDLEWAEEAVRHSLAITEDEALEKHVIDLVAPDMQTLLREVDGRSVETASGARILHTANAMIEQADMGIIEEILNVISDPNIAYILLLMGLFGILFELFNPGLILPGVVGGISLLLAFYAMQALPVNYAGLALILFAIILFVLEIKIISHGILAIGGILSLLFGSIMLIHSDSALESVRLSRSVIIAAVIVTSFFFLSVLGIGLRAQRKIPVTGIEGMVGETGEALEALDPLGTVRAHGEIWQAESVSGPVQAGQRVRVVQIRGLTLLVEPFLEM